MTSSHPGPGPACRSLLRYRVGGSYCARLGAATPRGDSLGGERAAEPHPVAVRIDDDELAQPVVLLFNGAQAGDIGRAQALPEQQRVPDVDESLPRPPGRLTLRRAARTVRREVELDAIDVGDQIALESRHDLEADGRP